MAACLVAAPRASSSLFWLGTNAAGSTSMPRMPDAAERIPAGAFPGSGAPAVAHPERSAARHPWIRTRH